MDEEEDEAKFEAQREYMEYMFPDAKFDICLDIDELDNDLELHEVVFKHTYNCYCYDKNKRPTDYFVCRDTKPITKRKVIQELCRQGFNPNCNHIFLEHINRIGNGMEVEGFFGS
jgi:hypothetical protein